MDGARSLMEPARATSGAERVVAVLVGLLLVGACVDLGAHLVRGNTAVGLASSGQAVSRRSALALAAASGFPRRADAQTAQFQKLPQLQFIAADPGMLSGASKSGGGAQEWAIWRLDPGPRGVRLGAYPKLAQAGTAPAGWAFDSKDWWLEEHGLLMEKPDPLPAGRYLLAVLNGPKRGGKAVLTIDGAKWTLDSPDGSVTLADVTHLPCRSARYMPAPGQDGTPANARTSDFPVTPGAVMPSVPGTTKQDYAVLFVEGLEKV